MSYRKSCRKALESCLQAHLIANSFYIPATTDLAVDWPNQPLNREATNVDRYIRFSNHPAPRKVIEMGKTPRIEQAGFAKLGIFTKVNLGQDVNDTILEMAAGAFPYDLPLERDGILVNIGTTDDGDAVQQGGWLYAPLDVHWTIWRTP